MRLPVATLFVLFFSISAFGQVNFDSVKRKAGEKHLLILLNFSGSDWCIPCIRMKKEIFSTPEFHSVADSMLIFIDADFPRNKKNRLTPELQKYNDQLADLYNSNGHFPFTLLLNAKGEIRRTWDGLPKENVTQFLQEIRVDYGTCK